MLCNVGWVERTVRILVGLPMAVSYLYVRHFSMVWSYSLLVLGVALVLSSAAGWCPLHHVLGTSTSKQSIASAGQ